MDTSVTRLQQIAITLPHEHLKEVINFAEFLSLKARKNRTQAARKSSRKNELDIPVIKGVKFIGDPRLRREDLYDDRGR